MYMRQMRQNDAVNIFNEYIMFWYKNPEIWQYKQYILYPNSDITV